MNQNKRRGLLAGVFVAGLFMLVVLWLDYRDRQSKAAKEPAEYVQQVRKRFAEKRERFPIFISRDSREDEKRKFAAAGGKWPEPVIEGRLVILHSGYEFHPAHFQLPRAKRADDPDEMETVVFVTDDREGVRYTGPGGQAEQWEVSVVVYNLKSQTVYSKNLGRHQREDRNAAIVRFLGG